MGTQKLNNLVKYLFSILIISYSISCSDDNALGTDSGNQQLTIFFTNDMHGQLDNFSKIKHIVDAERVETNVLLLSAGDLFSGNPIVDQYSEKGFPIIDIMNKVGYNISAIGNHEFDYGVSILNDRMAQATFEWVCANIDASSSTMVQPDPYTTITIGDIKIVVLGLVETNGKPDDVIPSTHPWKVRDLTFQRYTEVVSNYENLKVEQDADLYIALTHLGSFSDFSLAREFPYFDVIIGGHSNNLNDDEVNGIPVVMAGGNLSHLGKMVMTIRDREIVDYEVTLINLANYTNEDQELANAISEYNNAPEFAEVVGFANSHHDRNELGCFYTTALKEYMQVDFSIQNGGGIRADIDQGDITRYEIYNMDPFNNGSVAFTMTAREIKDFFIESGAGLHVSGISLVRSGNDIQIFNEDGVEISDEVELTLGTNDYIPSIYDNFFSFEDAEIRELTTAESIIGYLKTINSTMDHESCNQFFRY